MREPFDVVVVVIFEEVEFVIEGGSGVYDGYEDVAEHVDGQYGNGPGAPVFFGRLGSSLAGFSCCPAGWVVSGFVADGPFG